MIVVVPILIFLAIIIARISKGMFVALLVVIATKSIVDAFWNVTIGPLSVLSFQGVLLPLIFLKVFQRRKLFPKSWRISAFIYIVALSLGLVWALSEKLLPTVELIFLNINIFLGFFILPFLVNSPERLKKVLVAIIIAGIFPIIISIYQYQTGFIFQDRETAGGLVRYVGLYHDAFPTRFYGLMTLFAVLMYITNFRPQKKIYTLVLVGVSIGALFSLYLVFSKAAVGILGLWVMLLLLFSKSKIRQLLSIFVGVSVVFLVFGDVFFENLEQLFSKEIGYQEGDITDSRYTLAGRGYLWEDYWEFWLNEQSAFFQWIGDGINRPTHNEFLRILLISGIMGLFLLIIFLLRVVVRTIRITKELRVFGLMLLGMFIIDSIGLTPGVYYYYNILVWGILGLLIYNPAIFNLKLKR